MKSNNATYSSIISLLSHCRFERSQTKRRSHWPPGRELACSQHKLEGQKDLEIIGYAADTNFETNTYE